MKIKLLPFDEAVKKSKECSKKHLTFTGISCIGISSYLWKDNSILEVRFKTDDGYFYGDDHFYYCACCCEVIEE